MVISLTDRIIVHIYNNNNRKHGKCRHSSVSIDSKILIFGGYA